MRRFTFPFAFLAFALSIYFGLHYYLWVRLLHQTSLPGVLALFGTIVLATLSAIPVLFEVLPLVLGFKAPEFFKRIALFWIGSYFLLAASVAGADLLGLIVRLAGAPLPLAALGTHDGVAILGAAGGMLCTLLAVWGGLRQPRLREVHLSAAGLPPALAGLTVVQLSDVHIGPTLGADFLGRIVDRVNALSPDLVAITGDLVDGTVEHTGPQLLALRALRPRLGVVYVPGNHEYYHGGPAWFAFLQSLGLRVLRNEGVVLGEGPRAFYVAGADDPTSKRAGGDGWDLAGALRERPAGMATLLLSHQPLGFEQAAAQGVSLQLSGHTHGGQLFPFSLLVGLRYRFVAGLYRNGLSYLYVSRGTGFWGPPMRLGSPSEITRLSFAS